MAFQRRVGWGDARRIAARKENALRRALPAFLAVLTALLTACPGEPERPASDGPEETATVDDRPDPSVCLRGEPFVADGPLPLEAGAGDLEAAPGDLETGARDLEAADRGSEPGARDPDLQAGAPHQVAGLRWEAHEGCERFVIDLVDEDGHPAAAPGDVTAEVLRHLGVVRVSLRDVRWVDPDATDARFEGPLARAAYAVWSPDGPWTYVDLHLADEAEAHVARARDPARVVVDLRPGGGPIPDSPAKGRLVVVLEPRAGEASYPLTVTGYARAFEANVVARIERDGEEIAETFTTATAWVDAWGHYSLAFEDGPSGPIELHVGEYSAKDGTWEGAVVELTME